MQWISWEIKMSYMEGETIQIEGKSRYKTRILATLEKLSYCYYLFDFFFGSIFSMRKLK